MPANFHTLYDWTSSSTWIADGDRRIARIQPPRLHDVVLLPGGDPLVTWLTLFWWQYTNNETSERSAWHVDALTLDDHDPACYRLGLRSHNADRSVTSETELNLTLDEARSTYRYDVHTSLEVQQGARWVVEPQGGVEFVNPWYQEAVGAAVDFPGMRPPRWRWVIYVDQHGRIVRLPLNHLGSPYLERIQFPPTGGWLGFFNHEDGNPVVEMDAETTAATRAEVCAWGYDVHFIHRIDEEPSLGSVPLERYPSFAPITLQGGQTLSARYSLYSLSAEEGKRLFEQSVHPTLPTALASRLARPAFTWPASTFQEGIDPDQPSSAWYWTPSHPDGVTWERTYGRTDAASLHIHNPLDREAFWEVPLGADFWMNPLPGASLRIRVWVRTSRATGAGAGLKFRYSNYQIETGQQARLAETASVLLTGDNDWHRVEVVVGPPPAGASRAYLRLALTGPGEAWFDDLTIEPLA